MCLTKGTMGGGEARVVKAARLATIIVVAHAVVRVVLVLVLALAMVALSREAPHWR